MSHGEIEPSPDVGYEYLIVSRILQYYFGDIQPNQIVALCHWALQFEFPAVRFFDLVELCRERWDHVLPEATYVYDICREHAQLNGYNERQEELCARLELLAQGHSEQLPDGAMAQLLAWYAPRTREHLNVNRKSTRQFPLDTFLCVDSRAMTEEQRATGLRALFAELPLPIAETLEGDIWTFGGSREFEHASFFVLGLADLVHRIWAGHLERWECPIYGSCKAEIRDSECSVQPWQKGRLPATCGYGAAAKLLHIAGRTFAVT